MSSTVSSEPAARQFVRPTRCIHSDEDVKNWPQSSAYNNLMTFIMNLNESVKNKPLSTPYHTSDMCRSLWSLLDRLSIWVDEIPPLSQPMRFGNKSFRTWHARLKEQSVSLLEEILPSHIKGAAIELAPYLEESFGNSTRIDYGTGHEACFVAMLCCLNLTGVFEPQDYTCLVLYVFSKYIDVMRKLQTVYVMEPAGSHGVWGLDDYHFLPFLWGASQLIGQSEMDPSCIHSDTLLERLSGEYLYFGAIKFIKQVKKGVFGEHSPLLNDISGVPNWDKVNKGLVKMFTVEVLGKRPVIQSFLFGSLLVADWPTPAHSHSHAHMQGPAHLSATVHPGRLGAVPLPVSSYAGSTYPASSPSPASVAPPKPSSSS